MEEIQYLIEGLERTPVILQGLLSRIPGDRIALRRVPGKWSIHEQICHLVDAQKILINRFELFAREENPHIRNYDPPEDAPQDPYLQMNMQEELAKFPGIRRQMTEMLRSFPDSFLGEAGNSRLL